MGIRDAETAEAGASALAPSAVSVRFLFVVIVCLPRSPAIVPVASVSVPGFGSRAGLSGPVFRPFDQVQVSENRAFPELAFRGRFRGFRPFRPPSLPSASPSPRFRSVPTRLPVPPSASPSPRSCSVPVQIRTAFRLCRLSSRSTTRSRPPVPLVCCSFCSWFVSRSFVWFRSFSSAQFVSSFRSLIRPVRFRSFQFRFELISLCSPVRVRVI